MLNRAIKKTTYSFIQKRGGARRKDFYRIIILLREFGKNTEYKYTESTFLGIARDYLRGIKVKFIGYFTLNVKNVKHKMKTFRL